MRWCNAEAAFTALETAVCRQLRRAAAAQSPRAGFRQHLDNISTTAGVYRCCFAVHAAKARAVQNLLRLQACCATAPWQPVCFWAVLFKTSSNESTYGGQRALHEIYLAGCTGCLVRRLMGGGGALHSRAPTLLKYSATELLRLIMAQFKGVLLRLRCRVRGGGLRLRH